DVLIDGLADVGAFETDDGVVDPGAAHRMDVADQVAAPAVPAYALCIVVFVESLPYGRLLDVPARAAPYGVALDVLVGAGEETLERAAGGVQRDDRHGAPVGIAVEPALRGAALERGGIRGHQRRRRLGIVAMGTAHNAVD